MKKYTVGIEQVYIHYVHVEVDVEGVLWDKGGFEKVCEAAAEKMAEDGGIGDPEYLRDNSHEDWDIEKGHG